jgi:putative transposase
VDVRFTRRFRDVQEVRTTRAVIGLDETVRPWCHTCGQTFANDLRRRRARRGDTWHRDDLFRTISGKRPYLGRAVDHAGTVLDRLVQRRRNPHAAKTFVRTGLKGGTDMPRVLSPATRAR